VLDGGREDQPGRTLKVILVKLPKEREQKERKKEKDMEGREKGPWEV
jgi:hypothetical protein